MRPPKSTTPRGSGALAESTNTNTNVGDYTLSAQGIQLIGQSLPFAPPGLREFGLSCDAQYGRQVRTLTGASAAEFVEMTAMVISYWVAHGKPDERRGVNSYVLKHHVERWAGRYISNGAAIAAALVLSLGVQRNADPKFPNVRIGVLPRKGAAS